MFQNRMFKTMFIVTVAVTAPVTVGLTAAAQPTALDRNSAPRMGLSPEGLAIYQQSERIMGPRPPSARVRQAGLSIYHASEWGAPVTLGMSAEGLAIYQASERILQPVVGLGMTAEGLGIYRASESGRARLALGATCVPLVSQ